MEALSSRVEEDWNFDFHGTLFIPESLNSPPRFHHRRTVSNAISIVMRLKKATSRNPKQLRSNWHPNS